MKHASGLLRWLNNNSESVLNWILPVIIKESEDKSFEKAFSTVPGQIEEKGPLQTEKARNKAQSKNPYEEFHFQDKP